MIVQQFVHQPRYEVPGAMLNAENINMSQVNIETILIILTILMIILIILMIILNNTDNTDPC